jgi:ubiquinone/menaquinone biosynthesis C-methylase UbiE
MLDVARRRIGERFGARLVLRQASAEATSLPSASCDFVLARLLFQHLREPRLVAREARRILKPGGRLVITDIDDELFGIVEPPVPGLDGLLRTYGEAQAQRGGNRQVGRWLVFLLREAGFVDVDIESIAIHSDQAGLAECFPQLDPAPLQSLAAAGYLSSDEYAALRAAQAEFLAAESPFALVLLLMACGTKPSGE